MSLHAYVRWKLREKYGADAVPADGPIPAHLLGNMWAQDWGNLYPLVAPRRRRSRLRPDRDPEGAQDRRAADGALRRRLLHLARLRAAARRPSGSARSSPSRATARWSATPAPGTSTRWTTCASRCASTSRRRTSSPIHHELGHNFYQRAYNKQPFLFRDSANDGFHEAIGDTIALSITPEYLVKLGLLDKAPDASKRHRPAAAPALDKVAFLPFGLLIDQWRWKVFSGEIPPADYNRAWWELRRKYQGVAPGDAAQRGGLRPRRQVPRGGQRPLHALLPRATSSSSSSTARSRRRRAARGRSHRCSIYGNKEAGAKLARMLEMGVLEAVARRARGRDRDAARWTRSALARLLRAAPEVAGRAEQGQAGGLVEKEDEAMRQSIIKDPKLAPEGLRKIRWVEQHSPVLNALYEKRLSDGTLARPPDRRLRAARGEDGVPDAPAASARAPTSRSPARRPATSRTTWRRRSPSRA